MPVDLSIVIVSFNARQDLERCLASLRSAPPSRSHEIIVVDNASSDGSASVARKWTDIKLLEAVRPHRKRRPGSSITAVC
jgi:GT2 family glycosyltransferase